MNLGVCEEFTTKHSRKKRELDSGLLREEERVHIVFSSQIRFLLSRETIRDKNPVDTHTSPNDWQQAIMQETEVADHKAHL